jgi:hypothetical protein
MAQINNKEVMTKLAENANIQLSKENVPNQLAEKIVPTFETNPTMIRRCNISRSSGASAASVTIYTTPTDKDFYLSAAHLSMVKDATSTSINVGLLVIPEDGITTNTEILRLSGLTTVADSKDNSISIVPALKLKRGSIISITSTAYDATHIRFDGGIIGYTVDKT